MPGRSRSTTLYRARSRHVTPQFSTASTAQPSARYINIGTLNIASWPFFGAFLGESTWHVARRVLRH
eukprot:11044-Pyramimonas_sp.AAC.1